MRLKNNYFMTGIVIAFLCLCPQEMWMEALYKFWSPVTALCMDYTAYGEEKRVETLMTGWASTQMPIYEYSISYYGSGLMQENYKEYVTVLVEENRDEEVENLDILPSEADNYGEQESKNMLGNADSNRNGGLSGNENTSNDSPENATGNIQGSMSDNTTDEIAENVTDNTTGASADEMEKGERLNESTSDFYIVDGTIAQLQGIGYSKQVLHTKKVRDIDFGEYLDSEKLIDDFYTIDSSTYLQKPLSVEELLRKDMTMKQDNSAPQILIYHTHSQEGYTNSMPGAMDSSVVGAGEILANILREEYGYQVIHNTEQFDVQARDYAYSYALPAIEKILQDNPTIEVVIDLHRDAVEQNRKLLTNIEGYDMAQFMFFNGLSFQKNIGQIDYLPNPYLSDNLAFSFQMQAACEEYYPGLARNIYLKGYRYNMHLRPKTLLVELGAQTNTFQEAVHSLAPLARCLNIVLSGKLDKEI